MKIFLWLLSRLPARLLYRSGSLVFSIVYRVLGYRLELVRASLARSFPDKSDDDITQIARLFYRNYADIFIEMIISMRISADELTRRVEFVDDEEMMRQLQAGQPVLLTLAHQCNIEWLLLAMCVKYDYPVEAVYRPISNPAIEDAMTRTYTRFGGTLIGDKEVIQQIMQRREQPRIVAIASDQAPNISDKTYWTDFLHQETGFFLAPDTIARFTGYPVFFAHMTRTSRGRYGVGFKPIAAPPYGGDGSVVAAYVRAVEEQVIQSPADWFWLHRRWKRKRPLYD